MLQTQFIKAQVAGGPLSHRSAFAERTVAIIIVILAAAVLICLAAVAPAVWTFASAAVAESHILIEPSQCLLIKDDLSRLACYDELVGPPAKGAFPHLRAKYNEGSLARVFCPGINEGGHRSIPQDCRPPAPTRRSSAG
jgi:hypothetical protein